MRKLRNLLIVGYNILVVYAVIAVVKRYDTGKDIIQSIEELWGLIAILFVAQLVVTFILRRK